MTGGRSSRKRLGQGRTSALFAATVIVSLAMGTASGAALVGSASVYDGDTIYIGDQPIRTFGVDSAELGQACDEADGGRWPCAVAARDRLLKLTAGREVQCDLLGQDEYDRWLGRCQAGGVELGATLVEEGLAWAFHRYSDAYADHERRARSRALGVWQAPTQTPWDYRAQRRQIAQQVAPNPGCPIKGNIARDGERIYHAPWSTWYERTRISIAEGERWFCDEGEAVRAGWRAPRR
jgi:endonuclease YncB( thermonuclease family)